MPPIERRRDIAGGTREATGERPDVVGEDIERVPAGQLEAGVVPVAGQQAVLASERGKPTCGQRLSTA